MTRVAIYARKSTDQGEVLEDQRSVARQVAHARAFAVARQWTVLEEYIFVDDGVSGAEFSRRAGFVRLLAAVEQTPRPFDVLVMSEESRLGRESIETSYALKRIVQAGARVFFYLTGQERKLDTAIDKVLLAVQAFSDEVERERARQRVSDAMRRKALAGHVTGNKLFGYRNVDVTAIGADGRSKRLYVTREIVPEEAAVVRRIFALCAAGGGLKTIAHTLNAERALAPLAQRGRRDGWGPSSVREVLRRETYRGVVVYNKTRKRDAWGRHHQVDRPREDWVRVPMEAWRIVSDAEWRAAHARMEERHARYQRWRAGDPTGAPDGRGVKAGYLLSGLAKCPKCGGGMAAVKWRDGNRAARYVCTTYWTKGRTVCDNDTPVPMVAADAAARELLLEHVLRPAIFEAALDLAVNLLHGHDDPMAARRAVLEERLASLERQLVNLANTIAESGGVPALVTAAQAKEAERQAVLEELTPLQATVTRHATWTKASLRRALRKEFADWRTLADGPMADVRRVLKAALADRVTFARADDGTRWRLSAELAWDQVFRQVAPEAFDGLQNVVASPTGFEPVLPA